MNSHEIKTKVLYYFRYNRKFNYIATEVPPFNADVLVSDKKTIIECEVKVSAQDLKNDFKKIKHKIYNSPIKKWHSLYRPNKMFYAIPYSLIEYVKVVPEIYGIIAVNDKPLSRDIKQRYCKVIRQAKPISLTFSEKLFHNLIMRSSSELLRIRLYYNIGEQIGRIKNLFQELKRVKLKASK